MMIDVEYYLVAVIYSIPNYFVTQLGVGLEACFGPNKRQAIRTDQPKNIKNSEKVKLPPYP